MMTISFHDNENSNSIRGSSLFNASVKSNSAQTSPGQSSGISVFWVLDGKLLGEEMHAFDFADASREVMGEWPARRRGRRKVRRKEVRITRKFDCNS